MSEDGCKECAFSALSGLCPANGPHPNPPPQIIVIERHLWQIIVG